MMDMDVAVAFGLGSMGPAIAIGLIGAGALQAIARNPSVSADLKATMILCIAFAEAFGIFAFVIAMMIKFVK